VNDFNWKTKLDKIPDSYRLTQKDFDAADKLIENIFSSQTSHCPATASRSLST